ncbi:MAG: aldo/keto reductase [Truepera sp.]|nr:aldo/keto reductase [Truepera sp.]
MTTHIASAPTVQIGSLPPLAPLGLGTWAWGDKLFWSYGRDYHQSDLEQTYRVSLKAGVALCDTAEVYGLGKSERLLGAFAQQQPGAVIASKFFPYPWRASRRQLLLALKGSLRRLGVKQLDLYQLHWPFPPRSLETWADALAEARERGLIREVGISNCNERQMARVQQQLARRGLRLASNQVEYSLLRRPAEGLLQACRDSGVVLIAYSPLAQGLLSGKYGVDKPLPGVRGRLHNRKLKQLSYLLQLLREVAERHGKTPAQVSLNWLIAKEALPIPGAKNANQAEQNAGALGWLLSPDEALTLDEQARLTGVVS